MVRLQRKRFSEPANVRTFPRGRVDVIELDDVVIGRMTYADEVPGGVGLDSEPGDRGEQPQVQGRGRIEFPRRQEAEDLRSGERSLTAGAGRARGGGLVR